MVRPWASLDRLVHALTWVRPFFNDIALANSDLKCNTVGIFSKIGIAKSIWLVSYNLKSLKMTKIHTPRGFGYTVPSKRHQSHASYGNNESVENCYIKCFHHMVSFWHRGHKWRDRSRTWYPSRFSLFGVNYLAAHFFIRIIFKCCFSLASVVSGSLYFVSSNIMKIIRIEQLYDACFSFWMLIIIGFSMQSDLRLWWV